MSIQTMPKRITCWRKFSWPGTISKMPIRKSIARSNWIPSNLNSADSGSELSGNSRALHSKDGVRQPRSRKANWHFESQFHQHQKIVEHDFGRQLALPVFATAEAVTEFLKADCSFSKTPHRPGVKIDQNFVAARAKIRIVN